MLNTHFASSQICGKIMIDKEFIKALSLVSQIGLSMAACIFVGVLLGLFLDSVFNTSPWLVLIFSLLGIGAAFKTLFGMVPKK